jgi:hypothetical protein
MNTKKLISLAGIVLLALFCGTVSGQTSGGLGFYAPGIHTISFSKLNSSLPAGYPEILNRPFVSVGQGYGFFSNFVIGGEGGGFHAGTFTHGSQVVELSGSLGYFSLGYVVINNKGLLVFPTVSIGDNEVEMFIHEKGQAAPFTSVTSVPYQSVTVKYNTKMVKVSAAAIYVAKGNRSESGAGGLMVGLEVGYQMAYKTGVWSYDNGTLTGGPDFSNNAFFVQLLIGGGGVSKRSK